MARLGALAFELETQAGRELAVQQCEGSRTAGGLDVAERGLLTPAGVVAAAVALGRVSAKVSWRSEPA
jgi:hypothetical protein